MSSLMCYTLSALFCVLPPMKLHMSNSLVSHANRSLAPPFPPGYNPRHITLRHPVQKPCSDKMGPYLGKGGLR